MKSSYAGEIKFLRLNNGEDVIASIHSDGDEEIKLLNPLKILYMTSSGTPSRLSISLMQWVFQRISSEQSFHINRKEILLIAEANEKLVKYYHETIQHFEEIKDRIDEAVRYENSEDPMMDDEDDEDYQEAIDPEEGVEMLRDLLESAKRNHKKLH